MAGSVAYPPVLRDKPCSSMAAGDVPGYPQVMA
jgi:hypothetical protein